MNAATYTKIAKSKDYSDTTMSLGFRRYWCLPNNVRKNLNLAHMLQTGLVTGAHDVIVAFFAAMTEDEYRQYVVTH
jgi:hypothetical protein